MDHRLERRRFEPKRAVRTLHVHFAERSGLSSGQRSKYDEVYTRSKYPCNHRLFLLKTGVSCTAQDCAMPAVA